MKGRPSCYFVGELVEPSQNAGFVTSLESAYLEKGKGKRPHTHHGKLKGRLIGKETAKGKR